MEKGSKLTVIDICFIKDYGFVVLTLNKEYEIINIINKRIFIINDEGDLHEFDINSLNKYFKL